MLPKTTLVLGGANSGKSAFAERLVLSTKIAPTYIATAQAWDDEMREKIAAHQQQRGTRWRTIEAPLEVAAALTALTETDVCLLDCATLWLSNQLLADADIQLANATLCSAVSQCDAPLVIVSNEVGYGIVPENALARRFRAAQGHLNQTLAAQADLVVQVIAGLPQVLKGQLPDGVL
jgi:adenosylcobinamide kinase/adenosylcobinamide-phosphate guanylyltransferase